MIEKVFYNVFIFGTIISICISPLLIFLYKNKYKYKLKNIYKVFTIILLLLILPINTIDFSNIKNILPRRETVEVVESFAEPITTEIILETSNTIIEVNESINIKNNKLSNFSQFVPYLWISISIIFLLYNFITYFVYLYKSKKSYIEIKVPEIEEKINKICKEIKCKNISYAFSESITTPMVVGIFKKRIILPQNILETQDYEMILMHEIVHIKNRDIECKFVLLLINSIYWFNPVIYKFIDQVEEVLELKCDEIVLENQPQIYKIKYAQVLLNQIEENRNLKYRFSLNFANKRRNIMKRFSNIVDKNKKKNMVGISCVVASIIIISSAIVVSLPSINFASIQESAFGNKVDDNFVLEGNESENLIDNESVIEDENKVNENTLNENIIDNDSVLEENTIEEENTKATNIAYKNTPIEEGSNNVNSIENKVKYVKAKATDFSTGEVVEGYFSDEAPSELVASEKVEDKERELEEESVVTKKASVFPELIFPVGGLNDIVAGFFSHDNHSGIDFKVEEGTEIKACTAGTVIYSGYKGSYGNLVIIDHGNDMQTYYAHCKELYVSRGDTVNQGDVIAAVGSTGNSTGPHLHLELRFNGNPVNPLPYIKK